MATTQTMGSQGVGAGVGVGVGVSSSTKSTHLSRKGSLYSLTLDEFQNYLGNVGKPLGSMNLDELLRNVWTLEANQSLGSVINVENGALDSLQGALDSSLVRQSSFCLSRDLGRKTVEEVWREIQRGKESDNGRDNLGEMTLEDFLVKAGVSADGAGNPIRVTGLNSVGPTDSNAGVQSSVSQHAQWMQYQPQQQQHGLMPMFMQQGRNISANISVIGGVVPDLVYPDTQLASPLPRVVVVEKTVERRQKRMIKNRESAARSRARKQAYTNELENKVSRLEEENERLRRTRKVEKALPSAPPPQPKHHLRRTSSALF